MRQIFTSLFSLLFFVGFGQTTLTGTGSFCIATGVTVTVEVWGGGGGGGAANDLFFPQGLRAVGGGGGGGAYSSRTFTGPQTINYTVTTGAGGVGADPNSTPSITPAGNGGTSTFMGGGFTLTAPGGKGGGDGNVSTANACVGDCAGVGGAGGASAPGGAINRSGGNGGTRQPFDGVSSISAGGGGGAGGPTANGGNTAANSAGASGGTDAGAGGAGAGAGNNGAAGGTYGGGGAGGTSSGAATSQNDRRKGGQGGDGIVRVLGAITPGACPTMPITLKSFTAAKKENKSHIEWITSSETNNEMFYVERSSDGSNFDIIDQQRGAGNSSADLSYSLVDESPLDGVNYYRLKQVDFDGTSSLSQIESVQHSLGSQIKVIQSPAENKLAIHSELENYTVSIVNTVGQEVKKVSRLALTQSIDVQDLQSGIYYVMIKSDGALLKSVKIFKD
jgi:hypothetical protein